MNNLFKSMSRKLKAKKRHQRRQIELQSTSTHRGGASYPLPEISRLALKFHLKLTRGPDFVPEQDAVSMGLVDLSAVRERLEALTFDEDPSVFLEKCPSIPAEKLRKVPAEFHVAEDEWAMDETMRINPERDAAPGRGGTSTSHPREAGRGELDLGFTRVPVEWVQALLTQIPSLNRVRFLTVPRRWPNFKARVQTKKVREVRCWSHPGGYGPKVAAAGRRGGGLRPGMNHMSLRLSASLQREHQT